KRRLSAAVARGAGDVRGRAIEGAPGFLVGVEALIEKSPQEAAVLRGTEGITVTCGDRTALLILHRRCHVAQTPQIRRQQRPRPSPRSSTHKNDLARSRP